MQIDKFVYLINLETTILAYSLSKSLNYTAIKVFLQKLSTLTIAKHTISTRTDITLQTSIKQLRAIKMCSVVIPVYGYDSSTIFLLGDVYCTNTKFLGKLCVHKKTFHSFGRSNYQCRQYGSACQVRNIHFEDQTIFFLVAWSKGLQF